MDILSPEERRIVEEQQRVQRLEEFGSQRARHLEEPSAITSDEGMASVKEQPSWIEVLKAYGEHLSENELLVIRQQLSRDPA